jgi:DNA invertase Pin-like site-specific DNA recombinase
MSYETQKKYYSELIARTPEWSLAGIYADSGISGATAEKRPDFMKMIRHCKAGKIDLIITKSISRFARNTLDSIGYVRKLKAMGIGVLFEKENINISLDCTSEVILTILSSLAQEELTPCLLTLRWENAWQ